MHQRVWGAIAALAFAGTATSAFAQSNVVIGGLESPFKLAMTAQGNLLVSEATAKPNTARISLVTRAGKKSVLLSGLPSTFGEGAAVGVSGMILRERTLYILIAEGDVLTDGPAPGTQIPNPKGPSSPIFSSLLTLRLPSAPEEISKEFTLQLADHFRLADGLDVELDNGAGAKATLSMLTDFRDVTPDANTITRASDPFGMEFDRTNPNILYVADAGWNKVSKVDVTTGRSKVIVSFPPIRNTTGFGPPVSDVVPTTVRMYGDQLLVGYLTGFPFAKGAAGAYLVDPNTGAFQPFLTERTTVMDLIVRDRSVRAQFYALEFSDNLASAVPAPGALVSYDTEVGKVLQGGLITPVSMVMDPATNEIFVTELGTGRILKVQAQ